MCLDYVNELPKRYTQGDVFGYKVFKRRIHDNALCPEIRLHIPYKRGIWIHDENQGTIRANYCKPYTLDDIYYPTGFHCFTSKKGAIDWTQGAKYLEIYRVKIRNIVAYGQQCDNVIVARSIRILNRVK